jgi:uncharacterized repeat protein (TIGR03806 family)
MPLKSLAHYGLPVALLCGTLAGTSCGGDADVFIEPSGDASVDAGEVPDAGEGDDADAAPPTVYGLDARPLNASCKAFTPPPPSGRVQLTGTFPNVPLTVPVGLVQRPHDNARWYVQERNGRVLYFPNNPAAAAADVKTALDLRPNVFNGKDCALGGLAFPADFATSKRAYVGYCYLGPETGNRLQVRVSRFTTADGGNTFDKASEQVIVSIDHPDGTATGPGVGLHAADAMHFGKDGYLYVAIGDGGPQGKVGGDHAIDKADLRGKLLRIDVSDRTKSLTKVFTAGAQRLAVDFPPDNPFRAAGGNARSVYAYGFRNPWQWHFDRVTGKIWLGDVGNTKWEEVDADVKKGGHYGWGIFEGFSCTNYYGAASCNDATPIKPLLDYAHGDGDMQGNAITGGVVYRGSEVPSLYGAYIFADSSKGRVWAIRNVDALVPGKVPVKELLFRDAKVSAFREDQNGELYLTLVAASASYQGRILKLTEAPTTTGPQTGGPPALLSDTGCFAKNDPSLPAAGLIPFQPRAELWSDGAKKRRWFALPEGKRITLREDGDFDFPAGSVLVKEFTLGAKKLETRFFVRQDVSERWAGYTYVWNDAQTDAELLGPDGRKVDVGGQTWSFPSRADCNECHTGVAGTSLGLELAQLNHSFTYPSTGRVANQLATLEKVGLFASALPAELPSLASLGDTAASVEARARAYLHVNCSNCHRPDGPTFTPLDVRWSTPPRGMGICDQFPTIDSLQDFIATDPRLLAPGDPTRSVLYWRMQTEEANVRMPPLGRSLRHPEAVSLIADWIRATTTCPN